LKEFFFSQFQIFSAGELGLQNHKEQTKENEHPDASSSSVVTKDTQPLPGKLNM